MTDQEKFNILIDMRNDFPKIVQVIQEYIKERKGEDIDIRKVTADTARNFHKLSQIKLAMVSYYGKKLNKCYLLNKEGKIVTEVK